MRLSAHDVTSGNALSIGSASAERGGGWVHPRGANSMATSGFVSRSDLVSTGRAISVLFGTNRVRNK